MFSFKIMVEKFTKESYLLSAILIVVLVFSSINFGNFVFATDITGIISTNTTWTPAGSPYVLTGNVLVKENVTITIEPGTTVNLGSYYIQVDGTLTARGAPSNIIKLNSGEIRFTGLCPNWNEPSESGCIIENAILNSSSVLIGNTNVKINNCSISNTPVLLDGGETSIISNNTLTGSAINTTPFVIFGLNFSPKIVNNFISEGGIGLQYSFGTGTPLIENNFITNGGTALGIVHSSLTPIIRNNTITNNSIGVSLNYANPNQTILYNNIYENIECNLRLYNTDVDINATYNWWGTTNTTLINQTIVDYYDDFPLGVVNFVPILDAPNPNAPNSPPEDNTSPSGSIIINGGANVTTSKSVTLSLTYYDENGITGVRYSNDGVFDTEQWESPTETKAWTLTEGTGEKTVYYQLQDTPGNTANYSDSIILEYDLSSFPVPFTDDVRVVIPVSDAHGPCGGAHTMDTLGGILIANRLGLEGTHVDTAMDSYSYISTYDDGSAAVSMTDTSNNFIVVAGCGVNQVAYYYNELMDEGSHVVPVVFGRDGQGDYLFVQDSSNVYRIEYDESTMTADYGVVQIVQDGSRYVLLVYGLGGEATKAAAQVVAEYDQWSLSGQAAIIKYYDSDADGYLDTIQIIETVP